MCYYSFVRLPLVTQLLCQMVWAEDRLSVAQLSTNATSMSLIIKYR